MRIKLAIVSMALGLSIIVSSCGYSAEEKAALDIASSVPLPPAGFSESSGKELYWGAAAIETVSHNPNTGEAIFKITTSIPSENLFWSFDPMVTVTLGMPATSTAPSLPSIGGFDLQGQSQYTNTFTLEQLKNNRAKLFWKGN